VKLWLIERTDSWSWDDYDSAVVAAADEQAARETTPCEHRWGDKSSSWCISPEMVRVKLLGTAASGTEPGVILTSFNAG